MKLLVRKESHPKLYNNERASRSPLYLCVLGRLSREAADFFASLTFVFIVEVQVIIVTVVLRERRAEMTREQERGAVGS